jgi:NADPH-dependent curcumin reductase CurA
MSEQNRRWLLAKRPVGMIKDTDFERRNEPVPDPKDGEFLVRVTHLSFDPTQRGWMSRDTYVPAVPIGGVVRAAGAGQVVKSKNPNFKEGELVQGSFGWQDYIVTNGTTDIMPVTKLPAGVSPEQALGIFGITGLTAYFGLTDIGKPNAGDTVVVSGAAGATGSVVVQLAKALGCKVIGIAGGSEKCHWVVEQAKADAAIDYKRENVAARIKELAPKGVNVVFENVGGEILDASLQNLALRARVVLCGGISGYNAVDPNETAGIRNYMALTVMRARMEGFIVLDYAPRFGEAVEALSKLIAQGTLKTPVDLQQGFENIPSTMRRLFEGKNIGKQLLRIADPPLARN